MLNLVSNSADRSGWSSELTAGDEVCLSLPPPQQTSPACVPLRRPVFPLEASGPIGGRATQETSQRRRCQSDRDLQTEGKLAVMAPFLRIGFSNFEIDPGLAYHEEVLNPYCAVYMKEAVETG